jgi:putative tricarboxylic transport membrane protein
MVETFNNLLLGFSVALQPSILVYAFVGCPIGTLVGMMPGFRSPASACCCRRLSG